ncbi:hypothetical protein PCANC_12113 [Puccinia coronata f. sp. avenae]|uniref:Uncharacterized protein n=1 Tax=Puccinia coronata f. sp. avenae TaxID=200324 RepID=A0A2N5UWS7_9BASI|nr:hypothetical protein PCANC_12113 [Puccinia coronata f. sp. avenae]
MNQILAITIVAPFLLAYHGRLILRIQIRLPRLRAKWLDGKLREGATRASLCPIVGQEDSGVEQTAISRSPVLLRALPVDVMVDWFVMLALDREFVTPATLAEFKLNGDGGKDYYDISNVDGSNLPALISNNKGCPSPSCRANLNRDCPEEKMKIKGARGAVIGCLSACQANLDGRHNDSGNCCTGSHNKPETCPKSGVKHYDYFKRLVAITV